jgi:UDP-3-O-[3-hydroxymyristoyl] glucosamine N-acyltransferase LpxD
MGHQLSRPLLGSNLAERLGLRLTGPDIAIIAVHSLDRLIEGALSFAKATPTNSISVPAVIIAPPGTPQGSGAVIEANNPRLAFARALQLLTSEPGFVALTHPALIDPTAEVSPTAVLGKGVKVGARTVIGHYVVIADGVSIGADCIIKSNSVIGEAGFGFEPDEAGTPIRILHLGSVTIGDRVEIGSLNTVCRATLGCTIIEDDVKTDDHVHIAHNCRVRRGALLTACVELSGGVDVGEFAWIGPNSSVIQKTAIGKHAFVGIASTITKPVSAGASVAGNPARALPRSQ